MADGGRGGYNVRTDSWGGHGSGETCQNWEFGGIRLTKPLLEVAGLADEVDIQAASGVLTIRPSAHPRAGWAEAAAAFDQDGLLDEMSSTRFVDEEWSW